MPWTKSKLYISQPRDWRKWAQCEEAAWHQNSERSEVLERIGPHTEAETEIAIPLSGSEKGLKADITQDIRQHENRSGTSNRSSAEVINEGARLTKGLNMRMKILEHLKACGPSYTQDLRRRMQSIEGIKILDQTFQRHVQILVEAHRITKSYYRRKGRSGRPEAVLTLVCEGEAKTEPVIKDGVASSAPEPRRKQASVITRERLILEYLRDHGPTWAGDMFGYLQTRTPVSSGSFWYTTRELVARGKIKTTIGKHQSHGGERYKGTRRQRILALTEDTIKNEQVKNEQGS